MVKEVESIDSAVAELSGDALFRSALKATLPVESINYARSAAAAYEFAADATAGEISGQLPGKLRAARLLLSQIGRYLLQEDTNEASAQYVLAYPKSRRSKQLLATLRAGQKATADTITDILRSDSSERDIAQVATTALVVKEGIEKTRVFINAANSSGWTEVLYNDYVRTLRETYAKIDSLIVKYSEMMLHQPTAAARINDLLKMKPEELLPVREDIVRALSKT